MANIKYTLLQDQEDGIYSAYSDLFNLKPFAKNLRFVLGSPMPLSIIIDGGWGTGKTVFAKQLKIMIGSRARYINAFAHDYQDDVFTAILLSVRQAVKPDGEFEELLNKTLYIVSSIAKGTIKTASDGIVDIDEWSKESNTYIENVEKKQEMLDTFRSKLEKYMEEESESAVILVDELDRCKPKYALQVIEIIKHLYSVHRLHFVLIMNTKQIIKTIRHEHGCDEKEANIYLQKFYDLMLPLPNIDHSLSDNANISEQNLRKFIDLRFDKMTGQLIRNSPKLIDKWKKTQTEFNLGFANLIHSQNLNLREINKIFLHISIIACYPSENPFNIHILASLLLIQLREPKLFKKILIYYGTYDSGEKPDLDMNKEIRKFLNIDFTQSNIDLTQSDGAKGLWNRILNSVWSTDPTVTPESRYISSLVDHIEYLTFLNSSPPSEE